MVLRIIYILVQMMLKHKVLLGYLNKVHIDDQSTGCFYAIVRMRIAKRKWSYLKILWVDNELTSTAWSTFIGQYLKMDFVDHHWQPIINLCLSLLRTIVPVPKKLHRTSKSHSSFFWNDWRLVQKRFKKLFAHVPFPLTRGIFVLELTRSS
jgi:hypothetical protein